MEKTQGKQMSKRPVDPIKPPEKQKEAPKAQQISPSIELWTKLSGVEDPIQATSIIMSTVEPVLQRSSLVKEYDFLFLWHESIISEYDLDSIYSALPKNNDKKLLMFINSAGGSVEPAYLISQACRDVFGDRFRVVVPRLAKSAATLLSLGAAEIHMSKIAQLGPIDPQINGMPALGLQQAIEYVTSLTEKNPNASNMLASYLAQTTNPITLGYTSRVVESAQQYAERLLRNNLNKIPSESTPEQIGFKLVHEYKSHGFVIDWKEAKELLGDKIIKVDTEEAKLAVQVHDYLSTAELALGKSNHRILLSGNFRDLIVAKK